MQLSVTFRHMEATEAIKDYAREKVEKVKKYFPDPIHAHVVFSVERGYQHVADVSIQLHNGLAIKGREATENLYSSIDLVMAKIERQIRKYKEKIRDHKPTQVEMEVPVTYQVLEAASVEAAAESASPAAGTAEALAGQIAPKIIKTSKFYAKPLSVEEAVMQMNLLGNEFLVFRNRGSDQVNVVYRRNDGNYGLIETGHGAEA